MQELHDACLEWFMGNFFEGHHSSLQIVGKDASGEKLMLKLHAENDQQMYESSKSNLQRMGMVKFVALGEGRLQLTRGLVNVFIMYWQDAGEAKARAAVMPYELTESGYACSEWYETNWVDESWLVTQ